MLAPEWPADAGFTAVRSSAYDTYYGESERTTWTDDSCAWVSDEPPGGDCPTAVVQMGGHDVRVEYGLLQ